mmetsp:Transcript_39363/g.63447  ORF Transcript_39363/g.63447 Transcript_39363/m.63447 type:complete len:573 (+) Transcript_39363:2-1720(+)
MADNQGVVDPNEARGQLQLQVGKIDLPILASEVLYSGGEVGTRCVVHCCLCGTGTQWNASSMCNQCLKSRVDITEGIPRECIVQRCRGCGRYLDPPNHWVVCGLETKELLAICLKRIKGLSKVKMIDASFLWTEPHSRRIKVKLTVQKEAYTDVVLQQVFPVEFKVDNYHCTNCHKVAAKVSWEAVVQLRQRVDHKRTFYLLEQMILKHGVHAQTSEVKEVPDGIDFYFIEKRHSQKLVNFVTTMVPCRVKTGGERVLSEDWKNNSAKMKQAISVEIVPICKDDIFVLHPRQHAALGCMGPMVLVVTVGASLRIIDMQKGLINDLRADAFFRHPRKPIGTLRHAIVYTVLDVEKTGVVCDKYALAEVTVARSSDLGANDVQFVCLSHLGHILHAGDEVLGYDVTRLQSALFQNSDDDKKEWPKGFPLPDVVLIKKLAPTRRSRRRVWKLRSLIKEEEDGMYVSMHKGGQGDPVNDDYEEFMMDIESDPHARSNVNLYKDPAMWRIADDGSVVPGRSEKADEEEEEEEEEAISAQVLLDGLVLGDEDEEQLVGHALADSDDDTPALAIANGLA